MTGPTTDSSPRDAVDRASVSPTSDVFHRRRVENEVTCIREPEEIFGASIAQYADPDGLVFSVGEDRPAIL